MAAPRSKITFICREDFANVSTEIVNALRSFSEVWDARLIALAPHVFGYTPGHDLDILRASPAELAEATRFLTDSSAVVWAEEANDLGDVYSAYGPANGLGANLRGTHGKRRYTFHAGIAYRSTAAQYNPRDRELFDGQLCSPDLLRLANPGARCVWGKPMHVDLSEVDRLWEERRAYGKIVVTHSPSSHWTKGTPMIRRVMDRVVRACPAVEYRELGGPHGQHLPHDELMRVRGASVLHVDQYHTDIGGVGIAGFEAMARGSVTLASVNRVTRPAYEQWGFTPASFPLVPLAFEGQEKANEKQTERALVNLLTGLGRTPLAKLEARGRAAARWIHDNLSPEPFVRSWERQLAAMGNASARTAKRAA